MFVVIVLRQHVLGVKYSFVCAIGTAVTEEMLSDIVDEL